MGYELHVQRSAEDISEDEWLQFISDAADFEFQDGVSTTSPSGERIAVGGSLGCWTGHPKVQSVPFRWSQGAVHVHLILKTIARIRPGTDVRFELGYSALLRSMTSPFVAKQFRDDRDAPRTITVSSKHGSETDASPRSARTPRLTVVPQPPGARVRRSP